MSARVSLDRQTIVNACAAVGMLSAGIAAYAWITTDDGSWRPPRTAAHYMAGGLEATAVRLSREVSRHFAPGAPMPQVLAWFQQQGFVCEPYRQSGHHLCVYRRSLAWNQAAELRVIVYADFQRYRGAEPRVEIREAASGRR